jgi:hypothetical protein
MAPESHPQLFLENEDPEMTKPADEAGLTSGESRGILCLDNTDIPPTQRPCQSKTMFSVTEQLCADFRPLCGRLQPKGAAKCEALPNGPN